MMSKERLDQISASLQHDGVTFLYSDERKEIEQNQIITKKLKKYEHSLISALNHSKDPLVKIMLEAEFSNVKKILEGKK